jgi:ribonuclease PH
LERGIIVGLKFTRVDGRKVDELRPVNIVMGYQVFAEGSVLIDVGKTRVLCAVSVEEKVPNFLKGQGQGWVTAEYSMLPRSTKTRTPRPTNGRVDGRSQEIQRLIGRSLRAVTAMELLGERSFTVDCDVIQADGGTRCASITGGYLALYMAFHKLFKAGALKVMPFKSAVAAVSVGVAQGENLLDLCYEEDFQAGVDSNIIMTDKGEFVEVQSTAEGKTFSRATLDQMLALADKGLKDLFAIQKEAIKGLG